MVERDAQRAVADRRVDVVDDLLAGAGADALRLADVDPDVDGAGVVDAGEGGDVARLRGARAVVVDGAAGDRDGDAGCCCCPEEEDAAWRGHAATLRPGPARRHWGQRPVVRGLFPDARTDVRRSSHAMGPRAVLRAGARSDCRTQRRDELATVPFFDGLLAGEPDALIESFAGEPELHHPVRGRIRGARAFAEFVAETSAWLDQRHVVGRGRRPRRPPSDTASRRSCSTSTVRAAGSIFRSRSSPTTSPTDGSRNCGSTSAAGR